MCLILQQYSFKLGSVFREMAETGSFSEVSCLPDYGTSKEIFSQGCVFPLFITTTIYRAKNFNLPL